MCVCVCSEDIESAACQAREDHRAKQEEIQIKRQQYRQQVEVIAAETKRLNAISKGLKLGMCRRVLTIVFFTAMTGCCRAQEAH